MKKLMIILCALLLVSVTATSAFAVDYNAGVNYKAGGDSEMVSIELGIDTGYIGTYAQVGVTEVSGLLGLTVSLPDFPLFLFAGAGAYRGSDTITFVDTDTDSQSQYTRDFLWFGHNTNVSVVNNTATYTYKVDSIDTYLEAGFGVDAGPLYWKVGWTNYKGNSCTMSLGISI